MTEYSFLHFPQHAVLIGDETRETLPSSARSVLAAVSERGPLTHQDLALATGLPPRTIRHPLRRPQHNGLLESVSSLRDSRTCYFFVSRHHIHPEALEAARTRAQQAGRDGRLIEQVLERPLRPYGTFGAPARPPTIEPAIPMPAA